MKNSWFTIYTLIRKEYKIPIYTRYALPSLRYLFSVHTISKTNLKSLDGLSEKYLKKWFGIPSRGANSAILHIPIGLNIPRPSDLYWNSHQLSYSRTRKIGDSLVNKALDSQLNRESQKNVSTINTIDTTHNQIDKHHLTWPMLKTRLNIHQKSEAKNFWLMNIEPLIMQGNFIKILSLEQCDLSWKSLIYSLPKGVLQFAINASIDSLPSFSNLKRWGKRLNDHCSLCHNTGTLHHILSNCSKMLDRYLWRHNSILKLIFEKISQHQIDSTLILADLPNQNQAGCTIPPSILPTAQRPDLVIIKDKHILIFELTVPFELNITNAHQNKLNRYASLKNDLESRNYTVDLLCFEIGARGLLTGQNRKCLNTLFKFLDMKVDKAFINKLMSTVLACSYSIYTARSEPTWNIDSLFIS